ncbi:hypothetical protein DXB61_05210 [Parabacteroides merdae]|uniref:Uncharacterized protein n=1 Tax=Parabacteroides merdae TaxID=46503 RepID=A0A3R6JLB0_9BACT|nr:hypothetical protein DXB61_05210 [Parabacteroides merdae]RHH80368.1 hypothetical protein DW191_04540 [Parabacteroides merdae]RHL32815.1 hypothetical protein DW030_00465 [Parabacteroides merdae]RHN19474.1 hypothetical protein DWZ28_07475 [Parabacteroides merdae]
MKPTPILVRTNGYPFRSSFIEGEILFHWHESFVSSHRKQIFTGEKSYFLLMETDKTFHTSG